jgi:ankyrin repeat protein
MSLAEAGPMLQAAGDGDIETLQRLLEENRECANVVGANPYWGGRVQPLHMAVTWGQDAAVALLLEAGAHPSGENDGYGGWSPLMLAATKGFDDIATRLEEAGAYVGLFEAAALGRTRTVAEILSGNQERAKHVTVDGTTPLHMAATADVAGLLLDAGALPALRDGYGGAPLDAALARAGRGGPDADEVALRIIEAGADTDLMTFAALGDTVRLGRELDRAPGGIDEQNRAGSTPLVAAVAHGRLEAVRFLLSRGANSNLPDCDGIQPLHWSARAPRDHLAIARALLAAGANPNGRDGEHKATPASWAEFQRRPELERLLRSAETDPPVTL